MRTAAAIATLVLAGASWAVWWYSPALLALVGLDDLDIPGRVEILFLFLSVIEVAIQRLWRK